MSRAASRTLPLAGLLLVACSSTGGLFGSRSVAPERVPAAIATAEQALARDDAETAMDWMRAASRTEGLPPETRDRVQILLEQAAQRRIEQLSGPRADPDDLADLVELDLPRQIAVQAGLQAAHAWVARGKPMKAFRLLKRLDDKFPLHHERVAAGDLMADIGLSLKDDTPTLFGWFDTLGEAQEVLEYVVLKAPWAKRCDECFDALSRMYERTRDWDVAIARTEGLVLNHPASPLRPAAQARAPELRLKSLKSPEYDRVALDTARRELQEWLVAWPAHPLEPTVRLELADCLRRLCENDLLVSHFYARVHNAFGARRHAQRAVEEARDAGDEERRGAAERWLAALPPAKNPLTGTEDLP